ncbi:ABC transporter permease [Thauera phenylacetica]
MHMWQASTARAGQPARIAARNLLRHHRRTLLALAIICGGVVSYLLAGGFINWVLWAMREAAIQSQLGHVQITRPGYFREGVSDPYSFLLDRDTSVVASAAGFEVRTIAPRLAFTGLLSKDETTISFIGEGVDPEAEAPLSWAITVMEGTDLRAGGPDSVVLGEGLAANLGVHPGDLVVLLGNTPGGGSQRGRADRLRHVPDDLEGLRRHRPACTDRGRAPADAGRWCDELGGAAR